MDHGAWLRNCFKSMTNRVGDLCDISTGPNPISFPPCEEATSASEADDRPEDNNDDEEISEAEPSEEEDEDEDVEEIEEPVALQVESVAHRLVIITAQLCSHFVIAAVTKITVMMVVKK